LLKNLHPHEGEGKKSNIGDLSNITGEEKKKKTEYVGGGGGIPLLRSSQTIFMFFLAKGKRGIGAHNPHWKGGKEKKRSCYFRKRRKGGGGTGRRLFLQEKRIQSQRTIV